MLVVSISLLFTGCSGAENVGSAEQATTSQPVSTTSKYVRNLQASNIQNNEMSCTWSPPNYYGSPPSYYRLGVWVCGYLDNTIGSDMGWSWSADGVNWTYCNRSMAVCGLPSLPPGVTQLLGDPILVADGKGNVAYVQMANRIPNGGAYIVAALSSDGGITFPIITSVNNAQGINAPYPCPTATEDQPSADFDLTTDITHARKLAVVWRHNGSTTWGACINYGTFCGVNETSPECNGQPRPSVVWQYSYGNGISNLTRNPPNSGSGQSGLIVQAGDGAVALVYANCDGSMVGCPDTNLYSCSWGRVLSYDAGWSWSANVDVDYTTTLKTCVVNGGNPPNGGAIEAKHRATFAFARDRRNGDYYVVTMHGQSDLRLFRSQNQGGTWAQVRSFSNPAAYPTITLPTLASDTAGRLALTYIQSSDSSDTTVMPVFATVASVITPENPDPPPDPNNWAFNVLTSPYLPPVGNVRAIGDYNGIAVMDPVISNTCTATSRFLPAWTDTLCSPSPFEVHVQEVDVAQ